MSLRIGIIGAGQMTQIAHLPSIQQIDDVEVVAIADLDVDLARKVARAFNIAGVYDSAESLLDSEQDLDGMLVITPRMFHADSCLPVLERGIPVFMEKPLEVELEKGRAIIEACRRNDTFMVIGYNNRYDLGFRTAQSILDSGELGDIRYVQIHSFGGLWRAGANTVGQVSLETEPAPPGAPPPAQRRDGKTYPALLEWTEGWIHEVNMARALLGEPKEVVFASNEVPRLALVAFERARALFEVGLVLPAGCPFDCKIAIHCTEARMDLSIPAPALFRVPTEVKITTPTGVRFLALDHKESFVDELVHFFRCIKGYEQPLTTPEDAYRDLELGLSIVAAGGE